MFLEIVTPEAILFSSEVDLFSAPGIQGDSNTNQLLKKTKLPLVLRFLKT